jgi:hypothetical protein
MPTGYTAEVGNGKITDLKTFALQCARGMGALIMMRDEPFDAPIPERFEPSLYNQKALVEASEKLEWLQNLTSLEIEQEAVREHEETLQRWHKRKEENEAQYVAYSDMLTKVYAWQGAPEGLKQFMIDQLQQSINFDCGTSYEKEPQPQTGTQWFAEKLKALTWSIKHHAERQKEEEARTEARNKWIAQLRASLENQ